MRLKKQPSPFLSILIPVYNEAESIPLFLTSLRAVLKNKYTYEVIFIDDGSTDKTLTVLKKEKNIKVISFSKNFGKEYALSAGLEASSGEVVVPIDVDLQDPPELILEFIKKWKEGYEVVYAIRKNRSKDSLLKRVPAKLFYKIYNCLSRDEIPENVGDFRLMDRKVVNAILQMPERSRFMKGIFDWVGYKKIAIPYDRQCRSAGISKWNNWKLWNFALDGITASTSVPLRIWSYIGGVISLCAFLYAIFIMAKTIVFGVDVPGYASIIVCVLFLGGLQLLSLGIIGEYIGRIFIEVKQRPLYIIKEKIGFDL